MNYLRAQMLFDDSLHYSWSEKEHTEISNGEILDRTNGAQVLQFINEFAAESGISTLEELQEIEFLLRYGTPSNVQSVQDISELIRLKLESQKVAAV